MVFIFITLTFFEAIQDKLVGPGLSLHKYILETDDIAAGLGAINTHATKQRAAIRDMRTAQQPGGNYRITFQAEIGGIRGKKRRAKFLETLAADPAVVSLQVCSGEEIPSI